MVSELSKKDEVLASFRLQIAEFDSVLVKYTEDKVSRLQLELSERSPQGRLPSIPLVCVSPELPRVGREG